jgi:NitT/TauT family transport system ATP-binding protein
VLFVTHSLREALSLASRVLFLSPQPSRVILNVPVDLAYPRTIDDVAVNNLHEALLREYPKLLEGHISR